MPTKKELLLDVFILVTTYIFDYLLPYDFVEIIWKAVTRKMGSHLSPVVTWDTVSGIN